MKPRRTDKESEITLQQFLKDLNRFAALDFPVREVRRFLTSAILSLDQLRPYLFIVPDQYTRNLIHKSLEFELLLIVWPPAKASPIHGHEGEKCWARVESGELLFTNYCEISAGDSFSLKTLSQRIGSPGYLDGPADIHKVENPSGEPAVTLHLYSRPFEACDIYDVEGGRKLRKTLEYHSRFGEREQHKSS